nr:vegetative cell wall protein gp1-like [Aegilops tauschii subsp. strangulata]
MGPVPGQGSTPIGASAPAGRGSGPAHAPHARSASSSCRRPRSPAPDDSVPTLPCRGDLLVVSSPAREQSRARPRPAVRAPVARRPARPPAAPPACGGSFPLRATVPHVAPLLRLRPAGRAARRWAPSPRATSASAHGRLLASAGSRSRRARRWPPPLPPAAGRLASPDGRLRPRSRDWPTRLPGRPALHAPPRPAGLAAPRLRPPARAPPPPAWFRPRLGACPALRPPLPVRPMAGRAMPVGGRLRPAPARACAGRFPPRPWPSLASCLEGREGAG